MSTILLIIALIITILAVIFALQNTATVTVTFFAWQFDQSLALVLIITIILGVVIGLLTILPGSVRNKWKLSNLRKKSDALDKKLKEETAKREEVERQLLLLQNPPPFEPEPSHPANGQISQVEPPTEDLNG